MRNDQVKVVYKESQGQGLALKYEFAVAPIQKL